MNLIYLGHPYGGDEKNVEDAKQMVKRLVQEYPQTVFLSPLQATGFYYNDIPYIEGMNHCIELLSRADELWLCNGWEDSKGCCMEYAAAKITDKSIYSISDNLILQPIHIAQKDFGKVFL